MTIFVTEESHKIRKLRLSEMYQLLSPNYPHEVTPGATARWTLVTDKKRRIILVCPFRHSVEKTYKDKV